jgi:hypothetical protein
MNDEIRLDPAIAETGASHLSAAGARFAEARAGAGAEIAAATATQPWGPDEFGQGFERNYRPIEDQVADRWYALGRLLAEPRLDAIAAADQVVAGYSGFREAWRGLAEDEDSPLNSLLEIGHEIGTMVDNAAPTSSAPSSKPGSLWARWLPS